MTVAAAPLTWPTYTENGVTLAFAAPFRFLAAADLIVERIVNGVVTVLTLGTNYSVTGGATDAGGTVTLVTTVSGAKLRIRRKTPRSQQTDYVTSDTFPAETHELALDRLTMIAQELEADKAALESRALMVPVGFVAPPVADLAAAEGKMLGIVAGVVAPVAGDAAAVAGSVLAAELAAEEARSARDDVLAGLDLLQAQSSTAALQALVASEVAGATAGAYWIPEKAYLFQDEAGTVPVTATGQPVGCIKSANGVAGYDLVQSDNAKRGTYFEAYGIGFVRCADGQGYYSRSTVSMKVPSFIAVAAKYAGVTGRYIFGYNKNTNTRHTLNSYSLSNLEGSAYGDPADLNRPLVQAISADYSCPPGPVHVMHSLLAADNKIDALFEGSTFINSDNRKVTTWVNGDTVAGMRLVLNATSTAFAFTDASVDFYGGVAMAAEPANRSGIAAWLQARSRPVITLNDEVILMIGDSTNDNVGTDTGLYGSELAYRFAETTVVAARPSNCVLLQDWCREGDAFMGMQRFSNGTLLKRTFVINCSSAGSQPGYFFGERLAKTIAKLPKVDTVIWVHGHNLATSDATILADAGRKYLRAGQFLDAQDKVRQMFPAARHIMVRPYPVGIPGNIAVDTPISAIDHVAAKYGDVSLVDLYTPWDSAGRLAAWYCGDKVHPSIPTGVTEMLNPLAAVFSALPALPTVTPPLINGRKILPSENLLVNGLFESWAGGLPVGWSAFGGATVAKVGTRAKVVAAAGGIRQTIACTVGQVYTLVVSQEIVEGSDLFAGWVKFKTDVGTIGDGRWFDGPYQVWDKERLFYFHSMVIPAGATTLRVEIYGGSSGSGTIYLRRAVLVAGDDPRDVISGAAL